jgi:glutamine synthetase
MLESVTAEARGMTDVLAQAEFYRDKVVTTLHSVRIAVDLAESKMPSDYWPMPTYTDLLFRI